jgi:hypothetical protein
MINTKMRSYDFFTLGDKDGYGQPVLNPEVAGQVKMAIHLTSQSAQDNINYQDCNYIGLTTDKSVNDKMVIQYGNEKLKVLYVNKEGRFIQAFLKRI